MSNQRWLLALAIVVVAAGIALRFSSLDRKLFSYDEAVTSLRVAGYRLADYDGPAFDGRVRTVGQMLRFQHVGPGTNVVDVVRSLAVEDPQHPPLYYVAERGWQRVFGNSVTARRSLSALAGSLVLVAAAWLGVELFGSLEAGAIAAMLLAVSPFFVIYSQQAREYMVWALCTLVASALLLRAWRTGERSAWVWYGVSLACGLYADLLFVEVLAAHAAYVALLAWRSERRRALAYAAATLAALLAYVPWIAAVLRGLRLVTNNEYLSTPLPANLFALKWIFNTGAVLFDLDYWHIGLAVLLLPILAVVCGSFVVLCRSAPMRAWALVVSLTAVGVLTLLVPDLIEHESRSTAARYVVPAWLGVELAVAYALARGLAARGAPLRRLSGAILAGLLICGLASVLVDAQHRTSWAEGKAIAGLGPISRLIDAAHDPLVVYEKDPAHWEFAMVALSNELRPDVRVQLFDLSSPVAVAHNDGPIFVLDPTARVRAELARGHGQLVEVYADAHTAAAPIRAMRAEAAAAREAVGVIVDGLSLWEFSPWHAREHADRDPSPTIYSPPDPPEAR